MAVGQTSTLATITPTRSLLRSLLPFRIIHLCCSDIREKYTRSSKPMGQNVLNRSGGFTRDNIVTTIVWKMKMDAGIGYFDSGHYHDRTYQWFIHGFFA